MTRCLKTVVIVVFGAMWSVTCVADDVSKERIRSFDEQTQGIKRDVLDISKSLVQLEEKLVYPASTQISIFVSLAKGDKSRLDAVKINIDGTETVQHAYSSSELNAMQRGGIQRVYIGNLPPGEHVLEVAVTGKSANNVGFQKKADYKFTKDKDKRLVEITLAGSIANNQGISFRD